jgi:hypothetical protein
MFSRGPTRHNVSSLFNWTHSDRRDWWIVVVTSRLSPYKRRVNVHSFFSCAPWPVIDYLWPVAHVFSISIPCAMNYKIYCKKPFLKSSRVPGLPPSYQLHILAPPLVGRKKIREKLSKGREKSPACILKILCFLTYCSIT